MSSFTKTMSKRSKRSPRDSDVVRFGRVNRPLVPKGDMITKRLTYTGQLSSNGGGVIPVVGFTTAEVQSLPAYEWASFAARYQQFRIKAISLTLMPYYNMSYSMGPTPLLNLAIGDYLGTSVPGSLQQVLADESTVLWLSDRLHSHAVNWVRNPNAKLWNPTSAALPAANTYAICLASLNAVSVSTAFFSYVIEWEVEFRGAQ
jgi:hypothetical protein